MRDLADRSTQARTPRPAVRERRGRRVVAAAIALAISCATIVGSTGPAWAAKKPVIPSQSDVDKAKAAAQEKAVQIGDAKAQLAAASAQLTALNDKVESLVEAYNGAQVKLADAQQAAVAAQTALDAAQADRAKAQRRMNQFAADSYRASSTLGEINALVTSGSPEDFLNQQAFLAAISRHQDGIIATLKNAEAAQDSAQKTADAAVADQQKASDAAAKAKDDAVAAMNAQAAQVSQIKASQSQLQAQLLVLQGKAKDLADARAQGLAELAAEKAAAEKAAAEARAKAAAAAAVAKAHQDELAREAAQKATSGSAGSNDSGGATGPTAVVAPGAGRSVSTAAQRATAIAFAQSKVGLWYRWAGAGEIAPTVTDSGTQNVEGYDCSGLTMRAYQAAGISLGHYTGLQWDEGMHVSRDQLVPGDLVFFATNLSDPATIHHVGIYIGNGKMIDAPQTGEQVGVHNAFRPDYIGAVQP